MSTYEGGFPTLYVADLRFASKATFFKSCRLSIRTSQLANVFLMSPSGIQAKGRLLLVAFATANDAKLQTEQS